MRICKFCELRPRERFIIGPRSTLLPVTFQHDREYDYVLMEKLGPSSVIIYYNGLLVPRIDCLSDHPVIKIRV